MENNKEVESSQSLPAPEVTTDGQVVRPLEVGEIIRPDDYVHLADGVLRRGTCCAGDFVLTEDIGLYFRPIVEPTPSNPLPQKAG